MFRATNSKNKNDGGANIHKIKMGDKGGKNKMGEKNKNNK